MGQLENIVNVNITASTATPTRPGFGTPMLLAYHTRFPERVRTYTDTAGMLSDGFLTTDPAYKMAAMVFSQNPRPKQIKVGRRASPPDQTLKLFPQTTTSGTIYKVYKGSTLYTYTVPGGATVLSICTAIVALLAVDTSLVVQVADTNTSVQIRAATPGSLNDINNWSSDFNFQDDTADPGIVADIAACLQADNDWYGLLLDSNSKAEVVAAAGWCESNKRVLVYDTADTKCTSGVDTTNVMSTLKASSYFNTLGIYSKKRVNPYRACGLMGNRFPYDPGSDTWAFKTVRGSEVDSLTDSEVTNVTNKNGEVYVTVAGINTTLNGKCASGEYMDVTRFLHWLESEIKIRVFASKVNNQKIPYTDLGVDLITSIVQGALDDGVKAGGLSPDPAPFVTAPKVKDVDPITKGTRELKNVRFNGTLAGAIHRTTISGTVTL